LEEIRLKGAKVVTKLTISNCPNIKVLNLHDNKITEIEGSEDLKELKGLNIAKINFKKRLNSVMNANLKLLFALKVEK